MVKFFCYHIEKRLTKKLRYGKIFLLPYRRRKNMIRKINYFILSCDGTNCLKTAKFNNFQEMRKNKWAVSRDRKHCYCPNCRKWYTIGIPFEKRKNY